MEEFITQKGTKLFYEVDYELGGYNYFTGEQEPRAYNLYIKRNKNIIVYCDMWLNGFLFI